MTDLTYIKDLLGILKVHGVSHVKMQGLELSFHLGQAVPTSLPQASHNDSIQNIADTLKKQEEAMPPDLRVENINNQESVLNWSSPDQKSFEDEPELPLTGEQPL